MGVQIPDDVKSQFGDIDPMTLRAKLEQEKLHWDAPLIRSAAWAWIYRCEAERQREAFEIAERTAGAAAAAARWAMWTALVACAAGIAQAWHH